MPKFSLDLSNTSFEAIPAGTYEATVENVELKQAQHSEFPYLNWSFTITDEEFLGRKVWMTTSLNPKAVWKLQQCFEALGIIDREASAEGGDQEFEIDVDDESKILINPEVIGESCMISISIDKYQGRDVNRVDGIVPETAGDNPPIRAH